MLTRLLFLVPGLLTLGVCPGIGQVTLTGPTLGLFFDPQTQAIRPIWGIPGSATAGQPINIGFPVAAGLVSPSQDYALVVSRDGAALRPIGSLADPAFAPTQRSGRRPLPFPRSVSVITFTPSGPSIQPISGIARPP